MPTKKFIISIACSLVVLIVLSVFTIIFVGQKTHRTALLQNAWVCLPDEEAPALEQTMTSLTFNQDDTYVKITTQYSEEIEGFEEITEKGTFSIFNGKIKMTTEEGAEKTMVYTYDNEMHELTLVGFEKVN